MEIVNIFLAGSTKMEAERNLVRSYANKIQADQCAKGNDIAINITTFENFCAAITEVKAQDLYDAYIHSEADYAMFIFNNQVGEISKHEFDIAFKAFESSKKPKLYIYFKKSDHYCSEYQEIRLLLENTQNYFCEYEDFAHLTMLVKDHLSEIAEPVIEKIIIDKHTAKGYLTFKTNSNCSIFENEKKLAELNINSPQTVEFTEGMHCLTFKDEDSTTIIERKIKVLPRNTRTIEIIFPKNSIPTTPTITKPSTQPQTESKVKISSKWYYIFTALFISIISGLAIYDFIHNHPDDIPHPDIIDPKGGQIYQDALQLMENGKLQHATELLLTVINQEPDFADPYIHLANIYIDQGKHEEAQSLLDTALILNPDSEWAKKLQRSID